MDAYVEIVNEGTSPPPIKIRCVVCGKAYYCNPGFKGYRMHCANCSVDTYIKIDSILFNKKSGEINLV